MEHLVEDHTLLERHKEISVWLENLFCGKPVPQYEINRNTVGKLYDFMKRNKELDRLTKICIDDVARKTQEYAVEATSCKQSLEDIGLSCTTLSQSGLSSLKILSELAFALDLKDCTYSSYAMSMSDLSCKMEETKSELRRNQTENTNLQDRTKEGCKEREMLARNFELSEQQACVEKPLREKRSKETHFLKGKAKEYNMLIENLQETIQQTGLTQDLYHENLELISEELTGIRGHISVLKTKLSSFHNLPPDMSLARVKIEEAKQDLRILEDELYMDLEILNL